MSWSGETADAGDLKSLGAIRTGSNPVFSMRGSSVAAGFFLCTEGMDASIPARRTKAMALSADRLCGGWRVKRNDRFEGEAAFQAERLASLARVWRSAADFRKTAGMMI